MEDQETPIENLLREGKDLRRDIASLKRRIQNSLPNKTHLHNQSETAPEGELPSATIQEDMITKTPSSKEVLQATILKDDVQLQDGRGELSAPQEKSSAVKLARKVKDFGLQQAQRIVAAGAFSSSQLLPEGVYLSTNPIENTLIQEPYTPMPPKLPQNFVIQAAQDTSEVKKVFLPLKEEGTLTEKPTPAETGADQLSTKNGIPFMITNNMRAKLGELGFSAEKIRGMTPGEAHAVLNTQEEQLPTSPIKEKDVDLPTTSVVDYEKDQARATASKLNAYIANLQTDIANNVRLQNDMEMAEAAQRQKGSSSERPLEQIRAEITAHALVLETNNKALANLQKTEESIAADIANEPLISKEDGEKILAVIREKREILEKAIKKVAEEYGSLKKEQAAIENRFALVPPETPITPSTQPVQKAEERPLFNKENLSPFEQGIVNQESIESLTELLVSKEYKDRVFGSGTRAVTGAEMAKRISEKVIQAKKGSQVDPYFFIPDAILANKVHELLETSLSWQEGASEFGTLSFEKKDAEIKEEGAQKAIENTIRKVEAVTNPGMWKKMTGWVKKNKIATLGTVGLAAFLPKLFALFLSGATEQNVNPHPLNEEGRQKTYHYESKEYDEFGTGENVKDDGKKEASAAPATNKKQTARVIDPKTGYTADIKTTSAKTQTPASVTGIPPQQKVKVAPVEDTPDYISPKKQEDSSAAGLSDSPDYISPKKEVTLKDSPDQIFSPVQIEKPVVTQEKPAQFYSVNEMRNWFSQDKQKLAAFERVLHYADGQEEKSGNGQPNVRAFWWETMQLQKVGAMLPNKANSQSRNLTREYRNYHIHESGGRDTIIELRGLDDNQFMTTGAKLRDFDAWCKNSLFPATQQLEQKITQEEKEILADTTQTLGEYLTHVVYLGEKYGLQIKGIPTLTETQRQKVQNFQPVKAENKVSITETTPRSIENLAPSEKVRWVEGALNSARVDWVTDSERAREWVNGPFSEMINEYGRISRRLDANNENYTAEELQVIRSGFVELKNRLDTLGNIYGRQNFEAAKVNRILIDIDERLSYSRNKAR